MTIVGYRINSPKVINQIIDGEAVIINLESGTYYSLDKIGTLIWSMIENRLTIEGMVAELSWRYFGSTAELEQILSNLLAQLTDEELIVAADTSPSNSLPVLPAVSQKEPLAIPVFSKFTDMQELLLLDPIHDVDETGWPQKKPV